jgi:hypothetical protein
MTLARFVVRSPTARCSSKWTSRARRKLALDIEFFRERRPVLFLETHPFWWNKLSETWERISDIRALYGEALDLRLNPVDLASRPQHILFLP